MALKLKEVHRYYSFKHKGKSYSITEAEPSFDKVGYFGEFEIIDSEGYEIGKGEEYSKISKAFKKEKNQGKAK